MRKNITFTQEEYSDNSLAVDFFKEAVSLLERIKGQIETFADNFGTKQSIAALGFIDEYTTKLIDLYGAEDSPFSYHSMSVMTDIFGPFSGKYHATSNGQTGPSDYHMGRAVEQALRGADALIEQWKRCISYTTD